MKYIMLSLLLFGLTRCASNNPMVIAGYDDLTEQDQIPYVDIPCYRETLVHGSDTFEQKRMISAYRLRENQGYLLRFKDTKGDDKLTYLVEMDTACSVTRVTTSFPMEER
ncbi:MAG TPA: hypothetical protein VEY71_02120 [Chitinophagales bacterium]|nr:hypothetical protein [Chitinophagales bacterium]